MNTITTEIAVQWKEFTLTTHQLSQLMEWIWRMMHCPTALQQHQIQSNRVLEQVRRLQQQSSSKKEPEDEIQLQLNRLKQLQQAQFVTCQVFLGMLEYLRCKFYPNEPVVNRVRLTAAISSSNNNNNSVEKVEQYDSYVCCLMASLLGITTTTTTTGTSLADSFRTVCVFTSGIVANPNQETLLSLSEEGKTTPLWLLLNHMNAIRMILPFHIKTATHYVEDLWKKNNNKQEPFSTRLMKEILEWMEKSIEWIDSIKLLPEVLCYGVIMTAAITITTMETDNNNNNNNHHHSLVDSDQVMEFLLSSEYVPSQHRMALQVAKTKVVPLLLLVATATTTSNSNNNK